MLVWLAWTKNGLTTPLSAITFPHLLALQLLFAILHLHYEYSLILPFPLLVFQCTS